MHKPTNKKKTKNIKEKRKENKKQVLNCIEKKRLQFLLKICQWKLYELLSFEYCICVNCFKNFLLKNCFFFFFVLWNFYIFFYLSYVFYIIKCINIERKITIISGQLNNYSILCSVPIHIIYDFLMNSIKSESINFVSLK